MTKMNFAMLDAQAACDAGFELEITNPFDGEPSGMFVTLAGVDSERYRNHQRASTNELLRKRAAAQKRGKEMDVTLDDAEALVIDRLVVCTISWRADPKRFDGLPAFSEDEVRKFYERNSTIRAEVNEAIENVANFTPALSKSSKPTPDSSSN